MTCIVAWSSGGNVWMGADSAGVAGYSLTIRRDPKIFRVGPMVIGFTSSFRMGQLLGCKLQLPEHPKGVATEQWMAAQFIDATRALFKENGYSRVDSNQETGGVFLVGYRGRIFRVDSDYQIGENRDRFDAVGCGSDIAIGALCALKGITLAPAVRLNRALSAAERFSAGVRRPFIFEATTQRTSRASNKWRSIR